YVNEGLLVNSGAFDGMKNLDALEAIADYLESIGRGRKTVEYRLRDWGISRQRYWGAPIPVVYCEICGVKTVPEAQLPVVLPREVALTGDGGSPLDKLTSFISTTCPSCNGPARRETDTMDTFVESSWYFIRFCNAHLDAKPGIDKKAADYWMPVDQYIGGIEHAILHLLYARFYTKMLRDFGVIGADEPFSNLLTQGMVCKETMRCPKHGYLYPEEVKDGRCTSCNEEAIIGKTEKMSKSLKNIIDPDYLITKYGADTARMFCLFAAPPERDLEWSDQGVEGSFRFLNRVWRIVMDYRDDLRNIASSEGDDAIPEDLKQLRKKVHQTIRKVSRDIEDRFHFNTVISAVMELVNALYQTNRPDRRDVQSLAILRKTVETVILLLAPIVPHITEELWQAIGGKGILADADWPVFDESLAAEEEITIVIQVNGKVRSKIQVAADTADETIKELALADDRIRQFTKDKKVAKEVYVPKKLVNIVVR
ncbi:MAG: leucine--tRNA ligase, partial [Deltaproteobacteria bacterium]|nr:leucine--tRNA ligase [Deltaproteobacteria bacterium]